MQCMSAFQLYRRILQNSLYSTLIWTDAGSSAFATVTVKTPSVSLAETLFVSTARGR